MTVNVGGDVYNTRKINIGQTMSEWINVKDHLPKKGEWVLAFFAGDYKNFKNCHPISAARMLEDETWEANPYWCCCGGLGDIVLYWMPLPKFPEEK